jgi:peptide/nickel transport system permease protein
MSSLTPTTEMEFSATSRSYGAIVWRQLRKRPLAMGSLGVILLMALAATLAPFLAGEIPIRWVENGQVSWPIFRYIDNFEYSAMLAFLLAVLLPVTIRRVRPAALRAAASPFMRAATIHIILWATVTSLLFMARTPEMRYGFYLERADQAQSAWFPLIPTHRFPGYESLPERDLAPSWQHPLGTDRVGEDIVMRLLYGARTAMLIGFVAVGIGAGIGVSLGAVSGYFGRWVDLLLMRLAEIFMFIPRLVLIIICLALTPTWIPQIWAVVVILGVTGWTDFYRYMRAELLRIRNEDYMTAARALGIPTWRMLLRHAIPNGMAPVLVGATFGIAGAIFIEAGLAFLSLVQTPSWGELLNEGRQHTATTWWVWASAGGAIFITVLAYNLLGEAIRDAIDPKLKL